MDSGKNIFFAIFVVLILGVFAYCGFKVHQVQEAYEEYEESLVEEYEESLVEQHEADALRYNTFIDAGITVYADDSPVERFTAEIVESAETVRIGNGVPDIQLLLDNGYVMLVNGVLEPRSDVSLESVLKYYCLYEVNLEDKIIVLKENK